MTYRKCTLMQCLIPHEVHTTLLRGESLSIDNEDIQEMVLSPFVVNLHLNILCLYLTDIM